MIADADASPLSAGSALLADLQRMKPDGMTLNAWAICAGVSRAVWGDIRRHGNPSRRTLERLLLAAGSSLAEFEALRVGEIRDNPSDPVGLKDKGSWHRGPALPGIPVFHATVSGPRATSNHVAELIAISDQIEAYVDRPQSLAADRGLYAFGMPSRSMWPRFRLGSRLIVAPNRPCRPGDDALLIIRLPGLRNRIGLVAELIKDEPNCVTVQQYHPETQFEVPCPAMAAVHRVWGEAL